MKPIIVVSPTFTKLMSIVIDVYAIPIFPFIISKEKMSEITLNHETIHIEQLKEYACAWLLSSLLLLLSFGIY